MTMKTAISIPAEVFKAAEKSARRLGISRSKLYSQAVEEWLERHNREAITSNLNSVYAREAGELDPGLRAAARRTVKRNEW